MAKKDEAFNIGDVVTLKSNQKNMVIEEIGESYGASTMAKCVWLDNNFKERENYYDVRVLKKVSPANEK